MARIHTFKSESGFTLVEIILVMAISGVSGVDSVYWAASFAESGAVRLEHREASVERFERPNAGGGRGELD